ncbi:MAG: GtrA family protein [bacterium]
MNIISLILKKIKIFVRNHHREFVKYSVVGSTGVLLDLSTLFALNEYLRVNAVYAVAVNQIVVIGYVFFLNKYWTFKSDGMTVQQLGRFLILMLCNYLLAITWMWFFTESLSMHFLLARIFNIALGVSWNFLLYKYWVYKTVHK